MLEPVETTNCLPAGSSILSFETSHNSICPNIYSFLVICRSTFVRNHQT
ncbi:hypothetical protein Htur_4931 (plasmid) [Haloterrigena turkmenica DSM 5511]|uniref:Uncharacterized protein n=1 Tax=Haloterrigena turkmenica (strain ATCC 51198 / DSM 5511 / JCM 9101 / NCIMB 13204 / VKM B-1734 / 4k) TaxID=543526 RepID=D2S2S1_HALTV|nr:hypothetical protein Htur_4931 [Haloterrigena turkmenica DSM 5511]